MYQHLATNDETHRRHRPLRVLTRITFAIALLIGITMFIYIVLRNIGYNVKANYALFSGNNTVALSYFRNNYTWRMWMLVFSGIMYTALSIFDYMAEPTQTRKWVVHDTINLSIGLLSLLWGIGLITLRHNATRS